jgi:alkyl hydroperoxide reductase subunit D
MIIEAIQNRIPDYAKDLRLNLSTLAGEEILNPQQKWGTFYAAALTSGNAELISAIEEFAGQIMTPEAMNASRSAASIMAMNNVYYKFTGMMGEAYQTMPAKLRMNVIGNPGVDKIDFELWSLAVSAINGCNYCIQAHEAKVIQSGMSREQVQAAVRIAAVIQAVALTLNGEDARSRQIAQAA